MANIWTIYKREFKSYFNSPIAYIFMMLFLGFMGFVFFFFFHFFAADEASMRMYFAAMPWFFVVFAAAIAMRLWSEEQKVGTLELLLTMPVKSHEIVIGKYLAGLTIIVFTLALTITVPITVGIVGDPDGGKIVSGYVGALMSGAFLLALGACISATTENQIVAFLVASVVGILLLAIGISSVVDEVNGLFGGLGVGDFLANFSVLKHIGNMERGIIDLRDVVYFASMTTLALLMNYIAVESRKY